MLKFLFPRLTADGESSAAAFDSASAIARRPGWYREGGVPDTLDGRFAALTTVLALVLSRLERLDEEGNAVAVALTERFIHVMEAEHRELGLGDPSLGKTVRRLVGSLARRNAVWREAIAGEKPWDEAVEQSLYREAPPERAAQWAAAELRELWMGLDRKHAGQIGRGEIK